MHGRRNPFIAHEGVPWLILMLVAVVVLIRYYEAVYALIPGTAVILLYLLFRDPLRKISSVALGVFSPVDGRVAEIGAVEEGLTGAPAQRILIRINCLGTYTARAPVEGTIQDLGKHALWLHTDEAQDVVLGFSGYRFGLAPKSFARYGERLGQGQRCAYLRLTRFAEVQLPADSKILVEVGQAVVAGTDVIANVPSQR